MPKMKPHKALLKRVKVTGTGKVVRKQANKGHLMSTKSGSRRRKLNKTVLVDGADMKRMKRMLGQA